ncbi:two-component system histidine kinase PnpS [Acetohalobium arabaticum]|uniref:histidine kinase n=1 Tax=Acetohalobium arabaticum (strain ATCC 49924 / DSM 5501 / Z-7288) TaxID=574087 RepID=D9QVY1_ACEAZ|nr:ATP-binding protein [Acetohalobium arabaticum]ADL12390.1 multi-sensor signal transduction histidine kinase [Acetohalobium arabaticum DSM 5501]
MFFKSIRWKIMALWLVLIISVLIISGLILNDRLKHHFTTQLEEDLIKETKLIRTLLQDRISSSQRQVEEIDKLVTEYGDKIDARITIIDADGLVLGDSEEVPTDMDNHLHRPEVQQALESEVGKSTRYSKTLQMNMKYIALAVKSENEITGIVRLALPLTQVENSLFDIFWRLIFSGVVAIIISLILGLKLTKRITDPIDRMTQVAARMAQGNLDQRLSFNFQDELGRLSRAFNNMADKLEAKINEISGEKNKIEAILRGMGDGVIAVDEDGKIILLNPAAEEIFQLKEEKTLGKYTMEVTRSHKLDDAIMASLKNGEDITEEIETIYPVERMIRVHVTPIKNDKTTERGAVAVLRDVTELRRLEQIRTEFVSNVSHELRTPLTSIKGYVETLLDERDCEPGVRERFLQVIKDETDRLERLITDLLNLSQLESASDSFDQELVNLNQVIENVLTTVMPKADNKGIDLKVDVPVDITGIKGSRGQLERLYINLVDNGIKYTSEGGQVKIKVYEDEDRVWSEIIDTGMGIPEEDLPRIFERFYRVDKTRSRKLGGTGLGLSIVKHILERHNGGIEVESKVEEGTKFIFWLPKPK